MGEKQPSILVGKLNQFIRKYYLNQLIRGIFLGLGLLAGVYILFVLAEYLFRFNTIARSLFFYGYIGYSGVVIFFLMGIPFARLFHWLKGMSYKEAAVVVGNHFPEIQDKLLNALQLMEMNRISNRSVPLLLASIDQKIKRLKPFEFRLVIRYRKNLRYLAYTLPPLVLIATGLMLSPDLVSEPTRRIVSYNMEFEQPAPFEIEILNPELTAFQREDFELAIGISGEVIPAELSIESGTVSYRMKRESPTRFSYLFRSLQRDVEFRFVTVGYKSKTYRIRVLPKPTILEFAVNLNFPDYTGKKTESLKNSGDLVIPEGTVVSWHFLTRDVDTLFYFHEGLKAAATPKGADGFFLTQRCIKPLSYSLLPSNALVDGFDTLRYRIITVPDAYPTITIEQSGDSAMTDLLFFTGTVKDDYGFTGLRFRYEIVTGDTLRIREDIPIKLCTSCTESLFYFTLDAEQFGLWPGEVLFYFFEVWDNDGINGPKSARTPLYEIRRLSVEEMQEQISESQNEIGTELKESRDEAGDVEKGINELQKKMLEKRDLDWQEKRDIQDILKKSEDILQQIEEIKSNVRENREHQEDYKLSGEKILEKQRRLNELMEEMMTEELRKLMEEMRNVMDQVDKEKMKEMLKEMKMSASELEEQLDRNLELFRQIEFERKLEEEIHKLRELAKDQQNLAEELEQKREIETGDRQDQQDVTQRFDSIRQNLERLDRMEEEIETPVGLEKTAKQQDSISGSMQEASDNMKKNDRKNAVGKQKKSSDQLQELADQLEMMQQASEMEQYEEDARQIRQILENLLSVSFEQEELMVVAKTISRNDPSYISLISDQKELNDKLQSARDSLQAIGKRQFMIQPVITRELAAINGNVDATVDALNDRNVPMAAAKQQFTLTSLNTLAVLLDEAMKQMNQNMSMMKQGKSSSMCQNPSSGKGKKSMKNIRSMQEQLSKQLEQMKKGMEEQQSGQPQKGKEGEMGMTEQIARMAAQQEAIRQELQRYQESLKEQGIGNNGENEAIRDMEKAEDDMLHKRINRESIQRQQQILSRLLQSEKAELEREQKEEREANEAKIRKTGNPLPDLEYKRMMGRQQEVIQYIPVPLNYMYKGKANQYMIQILRP